MICYYLFQVDGNSGILEENARFLGSRWQLEQDYHHLNYMSLLSLLILTICFALSIYTAFSDLVYVVS